MAGALMKSVVALAVAWSGMVMVAQQPYSPYGPGGQGYGQNGYQNGPQNDPGYRRGFDDGMRSGQTDLQRGKRDGDPVKSENYEDTPGYDSRYGDKGLWKQQYRQGYVAGYQQGMQGGFGPGQYGPGQYGQAPYGQRPYGAGGYGPGQYGDEGYRRGFDDGMESGQRDFQTGKQGDPTQAQKYGDTPGYSSAYGNKDQWKQQYRQGYVAGYERGRSGRAEQGRPYEGSREGGNRGQFENDPAFQGGFRHGMADGQKDVARNKRNADITDSQHYGDTPGYFSAYGSKDDWKASYRRGYESGYREAWERGGQRY